MSDNPKAPSSEHPSTADLPDALRRAMCAYSMVYKRSVEDVELAARRVFRKLGSAGDNLEPFTWFQLIRDTRISRLAPFKVIKGGAT